MSRINTALVASALLTTTALWTAPVEISTCPLGQLDLDSIRSVIELESSELIVTDEIGARTVGFSIPAKCSGGDLAWRELRPEELSPAVVVASNTGFTQIVSSRDTGSPMRIDRFNRDLHFHCRGQVPLVLEKSSNPARRTEDTVLALYEWTVVQDRIFAYGALDSGVEDTPNHYHLKSSKMGFFASNAGRLEFANGKLKGEIVQRLGAFDYYVLGFPYLAAKHCGAWRK